MVRFDRLGHVLTCRGCAGHFRVGQAGKLTEVVTTSEGRWVGGRRALWLLPVAAILLVAVGVWGWHRQAARAEPELPRGLEERAELLARAWLKKDVPEMRRVTLTTHHRTLYSWFVRHQPPVTDAGPEEDFPEVRVVARKDRIAEVSIRVPGEGGTRQPVELRLFWEQRGDTWFFVPPPR
jgi:hypothetical protein